MPVVVTPIQSSDIPQAVSCIQLAFDDDPYNNWVYDKRPGKFNTKRNFDSLKAKCEWGMRNAMFFVAKDTDTAEPSKVIGVGMWMKPRKVDAPQSWTEWADDYLLWIKQGINVIWYQGWGGLRYDRYWIWKREQAAVQKEVWDDPLGYYFCNVVVVLPGIQGKGIGKQLFKVVTDMADAEGRKCYLESSRDVPNIAIYEKLGFRLVKKMVCEADGDKCDLFVMIRDPKSST